MFPHGFYPPFLASTTVAHALYLAGVILVAIVAEFAGRIAKPYMLAPFSSLRGIFFAFPLALVCGLLDLFMGDPGPEFEEAYQDLMRWRVENGYLPANTDLSVKPERVCLSKSSLRP